MDTTKEQIGAMITSGPMDWQIFQADAQGLGTIFVAGCWRSPDPGVVEIRLVHEDRGVAVRDYLDWRPADVNQDGAWTAKLEKIPAGGLYRLETRFHQTSNRAGEWSLRGDMRHCLGVGDLWVIAGQSNSAGYGRGPVNDPPELEIHLLRNSMQWALATHPLNESTDTHCLENREDANPGHSPYLHFARILKQVLGYPIGLVQTAKGGSMLSQWNSTWPGSTGELFRNLVHRVKAVGGKVKGILWYQGETEALTCLAESYFEHFAQAVKEWRQTLEMPDLPVITVQLNRYHNSPTDLLDRDWSLVREAQRKAAREIPGVWVVPSLDLPLSDPIHTSPAGNLLLAERMASMALGAVYNQPVDYQPPDVYLARAAADSRSIELSFSQVTSRMDSIDLNANCFRIVDESGIVEVEKVIYPANQQVILQLNRSLNGRAVVHGGYGMDPACAPIDVERFLPMLGFFGLEVQQHDQ